MKKYLIFLFLISSICFLLKSCSEKSVTIDDYVGTWLYVSDKKINGLAESVFSLQLRIEKGKIVGDYSATIDYGNKIDSYDEDNISAYIEGDVLIVDFESAYYSKQKAEIKKLDKNTILWIVVKNESSSSGEYYCPDEVVLKRY